jgi:signal peptidase
VPHAARLLGNAVACATAGFLLAFGVAAFAPPAFGMHTFVVRSGSMTPAIDTGDLVVSRRVRPTQAQVGDIVMFNDPQGSGAMITHRVRAVHVRTGTAHFVTRGDANTTFEHWSVPASGRIGQIVYRVPKLGYLIGGIGSPPGRILLIALPALLLLVIGLIRIWRPDGLGGGAGEAHP